MSAHSVTIVVRADSVLFRAWKASLHGTGVVVGARWHRYCDDPARYAQEVAEACRARGVRVQVEVDPTCAAVRS